MATRRKPTTPRRCVCLQVVHVELPYVGDLIHAVVGEVGDNVCACVCAPRVSVRTCACRLCVCRRLHVRVCEVFDVTRALPRVRLNNETARDNARDNAHSRRVEIGSCLVVIICPKCFSPFAALAAALSALLAAVRRLG